MSSDCKPERGEPLGKFLCAMLACLRLDSFQIHGRPRNRRAWSLALVSRRAADGDGTVVRKQDLNVGGGSQLMSRY